MPRRSRADLDTPPIQLVVPPPLAELPPPPAHLSPVMQKWWLQVVADYDLGPHHLKLLEAAADAWDRMAQARSALLKDGLTVPGRDGPKPHPAINIERDSRTAFARLIRELDLDVPAPQPEPGWRPPALRSNRRP
jgi:phage terminase small subunit